MKDSGLDWIGEIPKNWKMTKVRNFVQIKNGKDNKVKEGTIPVYGSGGKFGHTNEPIYTNESVLLGRKGTIDKPKYITEPFWAVDTTFYTIKKPTTFLKFFYYAMSSIDYNQYVYGSAIPSMSQSILNEIKLPYPSITEQQDIASFLDEKVSNIDSILSDTKESIDGLKQYKQSLITETVTKGLDPNVEMKDSGIEWIGKVPASWTLSKVNRLFSIKKDIANKTGYDVLSVTQRGLKVKDITQNEGQMAADYSKYQIVQPDDFVMNHMDLLTGWVDLAVQEGVTSPDYRVFYNKQKELVFNRFYLYVFQICYLNKIFYGLGQGVSNFGRWRLQTDKFLNFYLPLPTFKEQIEIVNYLDSQTNKVDSLIQDKVKAIEELEKYKKSLIYEYVTGKKEV